MNAKFNGGLFHHPELFELNSRNKDEIMHRQYMKLLISLKTCEKLCKYFVIACRQPPGRGALLETEILARNHVKSDRLLGAC